MVLILLEALGALILLLLIVWWTMFSGRKHGELPTADEASAEPEPPVTPRTGAPPKPTEGER